MIVWSGKYNDAYNLLCSSGMGSMGPNSVVTDLPNAVSARTSATEIHTHPWAGASRQWSGLDSLRQTSVD
jgi:hypothetical protein